MSTPLALAITLLLLIGNAYFVASEFAITGARRSRIEPLADQGRRGSHAVLNALENVTLMLATCQLGVTICSVALGAVSEPAIAHVLEKPLEAMHVPHSLTHPIAFVVALLFVVFLHVVVGEMVPKNVSITHPERLALVLVPALVVMSKIFYPIVGSLNWLSNHVVRILGVHPKSEVASAFTADEVASIVQASEKAGVLRDDADLLASALEFSEHTARDVMIPMRELSIVSTATTVADFEEHAGLTGYSRFPVALSMPGASPGALPGDLPGAAEADGADGAAGPLIGYIHVKDVLDVPPEQRRCPIPAGRVRSLPFVDADVEVEAALRTMQKAHSHMACVLLDSKVAGVIFLEDILEELVGEVRDAMQRELS